MRLKTLLSLTSLLAISLLSGCDSTKPNEIEIRVRNLSAVDFESLVVEFPNGGAGYGAVRAGQATQYQEFDVAYPYASVKVLAHGAQVYRLQPIDFLEEDRLDPGHYTYEIDLEGESLALQFVEE